MKYYIATKTQKYNQYFTGYLCVCFVTLSQLLFSTGWLDLCCQGSPCHLRMGSGPPHGDPGFTTGHGGTSKEECLDLGLCLNRGDNKAPRGCGSCRQHRWTGGTAGDIETLWVNVSY